MLILVKGEPRVTKPKFPGCSWWGGVEEDGSPSYWSCPPLSSPTHLPQLPSSLFFSSPFAGYAEVVEAGARAPPSSRSRDARPGAGDSGGEMFWLEDPGQSGGLEEWGVSQGRRIMLTDLGKAPQSYNEGLTCLQTTVVWLLLASKE